MKSIVGSVFCILIATIICSAQSVMYIPQVVDGLGGGTVWGTVIVITNPALLGTAAVASGTITFTQDNGTPWSLAFTDEQNQPVGSGGTIPFQIAAGETRYFLSAAFNSNGFNDPKLGKLERGFATGNSHR